MRDDAGPRTPPSGDVDEPVPEPDPSVVARPRQVPAPEERVPGIPKGIRYMVLGAFFFSLMSLLVKIAGARLPSQEIVLVRAVITLALSWLALRHARISPWGNNKRGLWVRGAFGFVGLSALYYAYVHLPLADATVIQYTNPVFTAILAAWWLKESLRAREVALALVSLTGVVIVARPAFLFGGREGLDPLAAGVALLGALFAAAAYVLVRRLRETEAPLVIVFYFALVSVIGSVPLAAPFLVAPTPVEWLVLLGVGVTTQLGQVFLTRGLHAETAARATNIAYLQIVFAATWGALVFRELPDVATIVGAALIIASTLLVARSHHRGRGDAA